MERAARVGRQLVEAGSREIAVDAKEVRFTIESDRDLWGAS